MEDEDRALKAMIGADWVEQYEPPPMASVELYSWGMVERAFREGYRAAMLSLKPALAQSYTVGDINRRIAEIEKLIATSTVHERLVGLERQVRELYLVEHEVTKRIDKLESQPAPAFHTDTLQRFAALDEMFRGLHKRIAALEAGKHVPELGLHTFER